ncbi:MAG: carboxypeptidase regulatory-like domain-containing protein [Candidatus Kerfeldbacteria bacterium]|nr:carboxypeptidase regulatory-like domain-containing protein [Candidatus Kerfeldbacteria bacterium]
MKKAISILSILGLFLASSPRLHAEQGLPPLSPELQQCLVAAIGQDRFTAIASGQSAPTNDEQTAMKTCFSGRTQPTGSGPELSDTLKACLLAAIGQDRFTLISSGQSQPTDTEKQKGSACFTAAGMKPPEVDTGEHLPASVAQCLKLAVGEDRFAAISTGSSAPTLAERQAGQSCFGATPGGLSEGVKPKMDADLMNCLKSAISPSRFALISTGQALPTASERQAGAACFSKDIPGDSPETILPPPTQEVPFLPEKAKTIDITSESVSSSGGRSTITLQGKGLPNAAIDIHVYSKGTTVSTQANRRGVWTYKLSRKLPAGTHRLYATIHVGKKTVRSPAQTVRITSTR